MTTVFSRSACIQAYGKTCIEALCGFFDCHPDTLCDLLAKDGETRTKAVDFLKQFALYTSYKDPRTHRRGNHRVEITDLTPYGADEMYAYEGKLEIRVEQHFYSKYNLDMDHPQLLCIEERDDSGRKVLSAGDGLRRRFATSKWTSLIR